MINRRRSIRLLAAGAPFAAGCSVNPSRIFASNSPSKDIRGPLWGRGFDGQRIADRGDGTFLNPIFAGDHPDPSIIKDGEKYYVVFSSFEAYPGLLIWESKDLVNWSPVGAALHDYIGSVWAPDLVKHNDRYYIYIPARTATYKSIYVISSDSIEGPWSDPVDLNLPDHIDPGHIVGEDGRRYLFLSNGDMVRLSDDGLATDGVVQHVYDPWRYPEDWDVECFCPEGPKMLRRGEWFYMLTAVGGTAGPPTGHMVIAARSKSVFGPWEDAPNNPMVRTQILSEKWWSRGHATLIEGPREGDWYFVYHGYENGFWTLGRQCLLEPARWRDDGWIEAAGGDLSAPFRVPAAEGNRAHGLPLSDDFRSDKLGPQWAFYKPSITEYARLGYSSDGLTIAGKGDRPANASPLCVVSGDHAYRVEVELEKTPGAVAGLLLFYSARLYCGIGVDDAGVVMHRYGDERRVNHPHGGASGLFLRIENNRHIVTIWTSLDGVDWRKFDVQMEVSGYHHNTAYEFLSLRPAIYVAGEGAATFRNFEYQALS